MNFPQFHSNDSLDLIHRFIVIHRKTMRCLIDNDSFACAERGEKKKKKSKIISITKSRRRGICSNIDDHLKSSFSSHPPRKLEVSDCTKVVPTNDVAVSRRRLNSRDAESRDRDREEWGRGADGDANRSRSYWFWLASWRASEQPSPEARYTYTFSFPQPSLLYMPSSLRSEFQ